MLDNTQTEGEYNGRCEGALQPRVSECQPNYKETEIYGNETDENLRQVFAKCCDKPSEETGIWPRENRWVSFP